ncbi:MAG TPA: type II CAAX endopeptidase family protein [Bryobacteraceae bacterium]|nr:type II CAAX endopeptidase family protein [Bryobacteraceae bacterium]
MQILLIALFLSVILGSFSANVQERGRGAFRRHPRAVWAVPALLTLLFAVVLAAARAWSGAFLALAALYVFVPTAFVYAARRRGGQRSSWLELAAILALWLPLEFAVGRDLLPRTAWNVANVTARGASITLALALFLLFAGWKGMKYNLPRAWTDLAYPALGFVLVAPVLAVLGLWLGYMGPWREPLYSAGGFALVWTKTLLGVALPEELLFRALVQNWLMERFGFTHASLAAAALVFGASHLNNPPGPAPNWRYMILATIAGFVFGKVYWKSNTILSSAALHATVNTVRHAFFR